MCDVAPPHGAQLESDINSESKKFEQTISKFLEELQESSEFPKQNFAQPYTRMNAWCDCYLFFQLKFPEYITKRKKAERLLEEATLYLSLYLSYFGMFRGSIPYLQFSKELVRQPLLDTFDLIVSKEWTLSSIVTDSRVIFCLKEQLKKSLKRFLNAAGYTGTNQPSLFLLKKILLEIFAAFPALDRLVQKGLRHLRKMPAATKEIKALSDPFESEESLKKWISFAHQVEQVKEFQNFDPTSFLYHSYPTTQKLDLLLWAMGKIKNI